MGESRTLWLEKSGEKVRHKKLKEILPTQFNKSEYNLDTIFIKKNYINCFWCVIAVSLLSRMSYLLSVFYSSLFTSLASRMVFERVNLTMAMNCTVPWLVVKGNLSEPCAGKLNNPVVSVKLVMGENRFPLFADSRWPCLVLLSLLIR